MTTRRVVGLVAAAVLLLGALAGAIWAQGEGNHMGAGGPDGWSMMGDRDGDDRYGPMMDGRYDREGPMMGDRDGWDGRYGHGPMMGPGGGMMSGFGPYGLEGDGPVSTMDDARASAQEYAERLGLQVGEVMEFTENYYAELVTASGELATEVLVDPDSGAVGLEYGPAMMWNTEYGMHATGATGDPRVSPAEAESIADDWLADRGEGLTAGEAEAFPGYYTLHTLDGDEVVGMLSVNASTGAVWDHVWHGDFVDMSE